MNDAVKNALRAGLFVAAGWFAGEAISHYLLTAPQERPDKSAAAVHAQDNPPAALRKKDTASEWQEFLAARLVSSQNGADPGKTMQGFIEAGDLSNGHRNVRVNEGDPGSRVGIERQIAATGPENFLRLLETISCISNARVRRQMAETLFAAWAQHDPQAAIAAADKIPGLSMVGLDGALKSWAEKDARGLMAWLRSSETFGWAKMQAQTNAFVYLTESDPAQAMQLAAESGRLDARRIVFINWYRRDPEAADAWIAAAPEADRRQMFDSWVHARSSNDPAAAWELALTQAPDRKQLPKLLPTVFAAWQEKDAPAARAALTEIPAELWEPSFASLTGSMLGRNETPDLETMVTRLPDKARAPFWAGVATGAVESGKSPDFAASAFAHLPPDDSDDRVSLADQITKQWLKIDPHAVSEWVRALPDGRARDMAAAALAEGLILTDPDAAAKWAANIRDDKMRSNVQKHLSR